MPAKKSFLYGGRKTIKAESIEYIKNLGKPGFEGTVSHVKIKTKHKGRTRTVDLAEKQFHKRYYDDFRRDDFNFYSPEKQFKLMTELSELNRKQKLGLRIAPTIRLRKVKGEPPRLLITKLLIAKSLSKEERNQFNKDIKRQEKILEQNNWSWINQDIFFPIRDKETKKVIAILADFGSLIKKGRT